MIAPGPSLADLAADEYRRRLETARRKVGAGALDPHEAEAHLRPWLALAARFGADLPELYEEGHLAYPYEQAGEPRPVRRWSVDICSPATVGEALAAARDVAIDRAEGTLEPARHERARRLQTLAIAFGCRPYAYRSPRNQPAKEVA